MHNNHIVLETYNINLIAPILRIPIEFDKTVKASHYIITGDQIVLYWSHVPNSVKLPSKSQGEDIAPILIGFFKENTPLSDQFEGEGSSSKGFHLEVNNWNHEIQDSDYASVVFKLIWIYYGK